ncbi:MAG: multicopper oxidase domain-containing protein [Ardenticatenales bacterium]|nr:multicopper oxidase domain-containing protein [Ardenticatenales bacterium]
MTSRRTFLKLSAGAGLAMFMARWRVLNAQAAPLAAGLSDPATQPKFINPVPDALAPGFKYTPVPGTNRYHVGIGPSVQQTGLVDGTGALLDTPVFGYGPKGGPYFWPGMTFEVRSRRATRVKWYNELLDPVTNLPLPHLFPVDTSLHWAYSLPGYTQYSVETEGVPVVPHLHGGHTRYRFDGNPEYFFSPKWQVKGPRWLSKWYTYDNRQPAGNLWYHDHALGITRLNVYAGLAGFYFVRDQHDTGQPDNPLGLPAWPYEKAYAIQDRMFRDTGELFYSAYPGDPFYEDFITEMGATLPAELFPGGGPTALAEFFGDHMLVNGKIWPKEEVEPRHYRLHLLNGTDSRFLVIRLRAVPLGDTDFANASAPLPFAVIGSDQGLAGATTMLDTLVVEPGSRYDVVVDFTNLAGARIIMENIGGDAPFGGDHGDDLEIDDFFPNRQTDRIMAFDVVLPRDSAVADNFNPAAINHYAGNNEPVCYTRKVALFEGMDEFGRLQPLLGTAEPTRDAMGNMVNGAIAWHMPTTEIPNLNTTELWEIYNATGDAHPVHLHLVNFEILERQEFTADVIEQPVLQHNGAAGLGFRLENIQLGAMVPQPLEYVENAPKDMVIALPGQVTRIKATFDRPGRYVWHCHILSHEDHEMMRVLHVGPCAE